MVIIPFYNMRENIFVLLIFENNKKKCRTETRYPSTFTINCTLKMADIIDEIFLIWIDRFILKLNNFFFLCEEKINRE